MSWSDRPRDVRHKKKKSVTVFQNKNLFFLFSSEYEESSLLSLSLILWAFFSSFFLFLLMLSTPDQDILPSWSDHKLTALSRSVNAPKKHWGHIKRWTGRQMQCMTSFLSLWRVGCRCWQHLAAVRTTLCQLILHPIYERRQYFSDG